MTIARPVFPGRFLFITRRCTQRQFLLRPDDETNQNFTYCLAEAAKHTEMEVVLPQMMSNHQHVALYADFRPWRTPKTEHGEHRKRNIANTENGTSRTPKTGQPNTENGDGERLRTAVRPVPDSR